MDTILPYRGVFALFRESTSTTKKAANCSAWDVVYLLQRIPSVFFLSYL